MNIRYITTAVILLSLQYIATAQSHSLLKDVNPGPADGFINGYYYFTKWNNKAYFIGRENFPYAQLWVSDGTTDNTEAIFPISGLTTPMAALEDHIILFGQLGDTSGLIRTDGTFNGTELYNPEVQIDYIFPAGTDNAICIQNNLEVHHYYGVTDGQSNQPVFTREVLINPSKLVTSKFKSSVIVSGTAPEGGYCTVFISDGTSVGTMCLDTYFQDHFPGQIESQIISAVSSGKYLFMITLNGDNLIFDGQAIFHSDFQKISGIDLFKSAFDLGDKTLVFLTATLLVFDHTTYTTTLMSYDVHDYAKPIQHNGLVYYHDSDGLLIQTNGTTEGTIKLNNQQVTGPAIYNSYLFAHDQRLFYEIYTNERILRYYDLAENTDHFFTVISHNDQPMTPLIIAIDEKIMYLKRTAEYGTEWWVYHPFSVSISEPLTKSISCYPNPATDHVTLQLDNLQDTQLEISVYNVSGMVVKKEILTPGEFQIKVSDLAPGMYSVTVKNKDNQLFRSEFVKK